KRILIIEDEPDIQAVARLALEVVGGYAVAVCSSGNEALATALAFTPDLILLDVMMPNMDGPTTLQHLRSDAALQTTPVVFMTARVQPQEIANYRSLGAVDVIPKPFDPMALPEKLAAIWQRQTPQQPSDARSRFEELHASYLAGLAGKLAQIDDAWNTFKHDPTDLETAHGLHILSHSLAGSGATFGLAAIGEPARELELLMHALLAQSSPLSDEQRRKIEEAIAALKQAYHQCLHSPAADTPALLTPRHVTNRAHDRYTSLAPSPKKPSVPLTPDEETRQLIYLLSEDRDLAQDLAAQISVFGYTLSQYPTLDELTNALARALPNALLVDAQLLDRINGSIRNAIHQTRA
ncbi:MAG TPA: response regulator, partial [Roseiflexaceae bacterium]|nr:response regulator [Roseiflexaceae bacterium]